MTAPFEPVPAGSIVVGVDGSEHAGRALEWAAAEAVLEHRPLVLAHGTRSGGESDLATQAGLDPDGFESALREGGRELLAAAREHTVVARPGLEVHESLRDDDPRAVLIDLSTEAAMVVLGSRGRGTIRSLLLGSVGVAVSKHAACPVVVLRPAHPGSVRNGVLVGIDGTELSRDVLEFAYRIASARDLPLTVLHSYWNPMSLAPGRSPVRSPDDEGEDSRLVLAESLAGMGEKFPEVRVRTEVVHGRPADRLVRRSGQMNLLVVGAHQGGPLSHLTRGSVAASVVEHARCAVAVVPARP